jgi:hypothetical protein
VASGGQPGSPSNPAPVAAAVAPQTQEPVAQAFVAPKKPQVASSSQSRRRDPSASNPQSPRVVRAEPLGAKAAVSSPVFGQGPFAGLFGGMFIR